MTQGTSTHVYEIFIRSTPDRIWQALTDGAITEQYYFNTRVQSDWKQGSTVSYYGPRGTVDLDGEIIEIQPESQLSMTFNPKWFPTDGQPLSTLSWALQPMNDLTHVTLTHSNIDEQTFQAGQMHTGWVYCLSSLKSLSETGTGLPDIFAS